MEINRAIANFALVFMPRPLWIFKKKWNFEYLIILSYDNTILLNKPQLDKYTRGSHDVIKRHVNIY